MRLQIHPWSGGTESTFFLYASLEEWRSIFFLIGREDRVVPRDLQAPLLVSRLLQSCSFVV